MNKGTLLCTTNIGYCPGNNDRLQSSCVSGREVQYVAVVVDTRRRNKRRQKRNVDLADAILKKKGGVYTTKGVVWLLI